MSSSELAAPSPTAPRRDARACGVCLLGALLVVAGLYALGLSLGERLSGSLPGGADRRALVSAAREVMRASELPAAEREQALRRVLAELEASRADRRSEAERQLIARVRALLGEGGGQPPADAQALLGALREADAEGTAEGLARLLGGGVAGGGPPSAPAAGADAAGPAGGEASASAEPVRPTLGQWVVLRESRAGAPGAEASERYTLKWLAAVEPGSVTIRIQDLDPRPPRLATGPAFEAYFPRQSAAAPPGAEATTVEVAGRRWRAVRSEERDRKGRTVISWVPLEWPVYPGLLVALRQVVLGPGGREQVRYELVGFGLTGGADRPTRASGAAGAVEPGAGPR